jgi:hypothetical protein
MYYSTVFMPAWVSKSLSKTYVPDDYFDQFKDAKPLISIFPKLAKKKLCRSKQNSPRNPS